MNLKLPVVKVTFILTLLLRISSTHIIGWKSELSLSSKLEFPVINYDCTIVNIALLEERVKNNVEQNTWKSMDKNQADLMDEQFSSRRSSVSISLYFNNSDSNNFQQFKRPISQKSRKSCFQAILIIPNSLEMDHVHVKMNFLKENIIPVNKDSILVPNQDKLLVLAGSWELLRNTFQSNFGHGFKYKAGLILNDPSSVYYSHCKYCEKSEQTFPLLSSRELWRDYESNMNHYTLKLATAFGTRIRLNLVLIEGSTSLYRPTTGIYTPLLSLLERELNFTYFIRRVIGTGIEFPNGTWTGLVKEIVTGNTDISVCVAETFRRHAVAEFSPVVIYEPVALISGHPKKEFVWYAIFWILSPTVWAMIGVSSGLSVLVIFFLVKNRRNSTKGKDQPFTWKMDKIMEYIGQSFLGQFDALPPQSQEIPPEIKIFLTVWLFFSFLVSIFYLSMLVGFLTFPVYEQIPETGEELVANRDFKVGITYVGGALNTFMRNSKSPMIMNLAQRMELNGAVDCLTSTIGEKKVCLGFKFMADSFMNSEGLLSPEGKLRKPQVKIHKQYLLSFKAGFLMAKRSVLAPNIAVTLKAVVTAGLVAEWERQDFRSKRLQTILNANKDIDQKPTSSDKISVDEEEDEEEESLLTFKHLKGAFLILLGGLTISAVCMTAEILFWGWRERQKIKCKIVIVAYKLIASIRSIRVKISHARDTLVNAILD
jgi:hypothetical protein